jgi:hypothetical protein
MLLDRACFGALLERPSIPPTDMTRSSKLVTVGDAWIISTPRNAHHTQLKQQLHCIAFCFDNQTRIALAAVKVASISCRSCVLVQVHSICACMDNGLARSQLL